MLQASQPGGDMWGLIQVVGLLIADHHARCLHEQLHEVFGCVASGIDDVVHCCLAMSKIVNGKSHQPHPPQSTYFE